MQAMYTRISFRGAKTGKIGKERYVLGQIDKFWKGHDTQIKKNACKNAYLGSIFIPEKYVFRVCFESRFTRMISSLKYKWPPGQRLSPFLADFWDFFELFHNFISVPISKSPLWSSQLVCPIPSSANNFPFRPCRSLEAGVFRRPCSTFKISMPYPPSANNFEHSMFCRPCHARPVF